MKNGVSIACQDEARREGCGTALGMVMDNEHDKGLDDWFRALDAQDAQQRFDGTPAGEPVLLMVHEAAVLRWALEIMLDGYDGNIHPEKYEDDERIEFDGMQAVIEGTDWGELGFAHQSPRDDANNPPSPVAHALRGYEVGIAELEDGFSEEVQDYRERNEPFLSVLRAAFLMWHQDEQDEGENIKQQVLSGLGLAGTPAGEGIGEYRLMLVHTGEEGLDEELIALLGEPDGSGQWMAGGAEFPRDMDWSFTPDDVPGEATLKKVEAVLRMGTDKPRGEYTLNEQDD